MKFDWWLVIPCLLLSILGLTVIRAVSPDLSFIQFVFMIIAIIVFLVFSKIDYIFFFALYLPAYIASVIFLITPFFFGTISRGATRWLQIGDFSLQPSEIVKPFLLIAFSMLAAGASKNKLLYLALSIIPPFTIVFLQPDLGTSLVILIGWATIMLTQLRMKTVALVLVSFALLLLPIYKFALHDYQRQRIITFLNPYHDPLGQGYHVIQSIIATGSGKFGARGLGHGTQSQLRFLPEYHTDFIFASLSESFGFIGSISVVSLFSLLIWRIYRISQGTLSKAASFFCISSAALMSFQVFVNIGMNIGLAPVTGITLPFLSYGGSSLLSLGITLGLINSISTQSKQSTNY